MVRFANAMSGLPVVNVQNLGHSLGFCRGSSGFFAMGDLNGIEFNTGSIPDGEYCDVVSDCAQKISVVEGKAVVNAFDPGEDPAVALCVGDVCQ